MVKRAFLAASVIAFLVLKVDAAPAPTPTSPGTPTPGASGATPQPGGTPAASVSKSEVPPSTSLKAPQSVISAESYRGFLLHSETALRTIQKSGPRTPANIRRALPPGVRVKRSDGETQTADNRDLRALANSSPSRSDPGAPLTKRVVGQEAEAVAERRRALEEWMRKRDGNYYQPADARRIITQLENTGQIRTVPTKMQQTWADIRHWFYDLIEAIRKWIFGSSKPIKPSPINTLWLNIFFYSVVFSLLLVIGYLLSKSLGGRWGGAGAQRSIRYLEGEDAELLRLPPDELRDRAARFAAEGNFREALRHLYISVLVNFDARGIWRYDTRRTNWEHIRALRADPARAALVAPMSALTRRFDRVRYGDASASLSDWQRFESDVQSVENMATGQDNAPDVVGKGTTRQ